MSTTPNIFDQASWIKHSFIYGDQNILLMFEFSPNANKFASRREKIILCITQLLCLVYAMGCGKSKYHVWITPRPKCIICTEHSAAATIHLFTIQSKNLPTLKSTWQTFNVPNILFSPSECSGVSLAGCEGWRGCCGVRGYLGPCGVSGYSGYWGTCGVCG